MRHTSLPRKAVAEFAGTFALVTAGCGAIMVDALTHSLTHVGVALTFGLIIMVMIAATGHLSGAHFNPAVTIAFAVTRHFPWRHVPFYILAQMLGAVLGAALLRGFFGPIASLGATIPAGGAWQSFGLEVLLSAVLMMVIISVATDTRAVGQLAALAIGAAVALDAMWGGPISGASMNPARSLGPALMAGTWNDQWVYLIAPIIGTCLGAALYQWLRATPELKPTTSVKQ
ncbi:MIP family channel protein [Dictyobacter formicarum]|uniref:Aquaporin n=1 Tax=Dictyobacter formicarum TaxID=2778368 RepID=A0ABQ3VEM0_9CHLR|nr:MIP family channel protein [Dictyobacter formicarum]GHO84098.1 aquaporin [Dictyobacter formicarum]